MLKHSYQSSTLASRERRFSLSSSSEEEGERMTAEVARRIWNMQGEQGEDRSGELKVEGVEKNGGSEVDLSRVEGGQESCSGWPGHDTLGINLNTGFKWSQKQRVSKKKNTS